MDSNNDLSHPIHPIQQKLIDYLKAVKPLVLLTVVFIAVISGVVVYWLGMRANRSALQNIHRVSVQPSPKTVNTATVIIQDGYFFKVTIPHEYILIKGSGDAIRYVTDRDGEKIIGFYIYSGLGESHPTGQTVIDGVPFTIDGGATINNKVDISCFADIYATNAQFKLNHLYFGIYTWCKDTHREQSDVYERVIRSIQFSEDLRTVLLGKSPPPMLRY